MMSFFMKVLIILSLLFSFSNKALPNIKELICPFTPEPPSIDGKIDDDCWKDAIVVTDFKQFYPHSREVIPNKTVVYLCYDESNLYVAFEAHTPKGQVFATETVRDRKVSLGGDETIGIDIDANCDKRTCFSMCITPLNTQTDGTRSQDGASQSLEWDGIWKSQTIKTFYGWTAELAIPFKILGKTKKMGINFMRVTFGEDGGPQAYTWCSSLTNPGQVSTFGILKGFSKIAVQKKLFYLSPIPYISIAYFKSKDWKKEVGIDVKYNIHPEIEGTIVANPDYAQIEADVAQIDLSKTGIQLPEKRPFFQNELALFETPILLFYTRSLSDIKYGTNLKYSRAGYSTSFYWVKSMKDYFVLRATKGLFKSSEIGGMAIDIENEKESTRVGSIDAHIAFPQNIWLYSQLSREFQKKANAYYIQIQRKLNSGLSFELLRKYIEPDFDIETGFIPFTDFVQNYIELRYDYSAYTKFITGTSIQSHYDHWEDIENNLLKDGYGGSIVFYLKGNSIIAPGYNQEYRWYQGKYYDNKMGQILLIFRKKGNEIALTYARGNYYGGNLNYVNGQMSLGVCKKTTLSLSGEYQRIDYGNGLTQEEIIGVLKCNYRILPKLTWRTFIQWSDLSKEFDANFLLAYEFFTGSHIYLVWNETRDVSKFDIKDRDLPLVDRGLFLKVCYQFDF